MAARGQAEIEAVALAKVAVRIATERDPRDGAVTLDQKHFVLNT